MKRREFIALLGGAAVIGPRAARAQQPIRRIGLLMSQIENDPEGQARFRLIVDGLQQLGWTDGRNVRFDMPTPTAKAGWSKCAPATGLRPKPGSFPAPLLQHATKQK
jgi:hypothetical protein